MPTPILTMSPLTTANDTPPPRRLLAVLIGIAEYHQPRLRLRTPVRDVEELAKLLKDKHGYEVLPPICDGEATRARLVELFEAELPAKVDETCSLLVYFAGHGVAINSIENPRGYLVPVDGGRVPADGGAEIDSLFSHEQLSRALEALECRHLLLVLDCCFGGAFRWSMGRDVIAPHVPEMYKQRYELFLATPARQVITSAAHDELAWDLIAGMGLHRHDDPARPHSPFFQALEEGLAGKADRPRAGSSRGDGVITATELYLYLRDKLEPTRGGASQTPQLCWLPKHCKGEYIFHAPGHPLDLLDAGPLSRDTSPYRGFEVYEPEHSKWFHGRRDATAKLLARVEQRPITIVVGNSGTGKSSLVRAGLIPALQKCHADWRIVGPLRVGPRPVDTIEAIRREERQGQVVLVLDHLEELFVAPERGEERKRFLDGLAGLTREGMKVVGTLRSDLETELWDSSLGEWKEIRFPLADMTREELREAIEIPAEQKVLVFDPPDMVDRLIEAVIAMPGALPLLSFTLNKLYLDYIERAAGDHRLVEDDKLDVGGIARALRVHADTLYERFDDETRGTMRRLLLRMVTVKGGRATRRRVTSEELAFADAGEQRRVEEVLDALAGSVSIPGPDGKSTSPGLRLVVRGGDRQDKFVELAHDAVAHGWRRFREWWTAAQDDLLLHRKLTAAAEEWQRADRPGAMLWDDHRRLASVRESLTVEGASGDHEPRPLAARHQLNRLETEFIERSRRARRRWLMISWGTAAVVIVALGIVYDRDRSVRVARERAEDSARVEQAVQAAAQSHVAGKEHDALVDAIDALRGAIETGRPVNGRILTSAVEAASWHRRIELPSRSAWILSLACSRDGSRIVTSHSDGAITVYIDGNARRLPVDQGVVLASTFTLDGSAVVTGDDRGRVRRWNLSGDADPIEVGIQPVGIESLAVSPDGHSLATGGQDGRVRLWNLDVKQPCSMLPAPAFAGVVTDVAFSRDGKLAAGSRDGTARVWSIPEQRVLLNTPPEMLRRDLFYAVTSVDFSPDGAGLLTGGIQTKLWELSSGRTLLALKDEFTIFARFPASGQDLITGGRDGAIVRRDAKSLRQIEVAVKNDQPLSMLRYCGDPRHVAIADTMHTYVHRLDRDNATMVFGSGDRPVMALAFGGHDQKDDGTLFAGLGKRNTALGRLERWKISGSSPPQAPHMSGFDGHGDLWLLTLSRDGTTLEIETCDRKLLSWDTRRNPSTSSYRDLGFDPRRVADLSIVQAKRTQPDSDPNTSVDERRLGVFQKSDKQAPEQSDCAEEDGPTSHPLQTIATSPAGTLKVITGLDGSVDVMDIGQARVITQMFGHTGAVRSAKFSPDGTQVATASDDGTARLWDVQTGAALAVFTGHEGPVLAVAFSHDGKRIATGGYDGTIRIFPVRPEGILALACSRLRGPLEWFFMAAYCPPD